MKKYFSALVVGATLLTMLGAGCGNQTVPQENPASNTNSSTTIETTANDFTVQADAMGGGVVVLQWTKPRSMETGNVFRLLNSAKPEPVIPGAFWYEVDGSATQARWANVPTGHRYFRVCEFKPAFNQCLRFSSTVELDVR